MSATAPKSILNVADFFAAPDAPNAKQFTPAIFHALASGEMQAMDAGEEVSLRVVVKKFFMPHTPMHLHFQVKQVALNESVAIMTQLSGAAEKGELTPDEAKKLGTVLSLAATNLFKDDANMVLVGPRTAHKVLKHSYDPFYEDLRTHAFMTLAEWKGNPREYSVDEWRKMAQGIEHRTAPALLSTLMKIHPAEFGRAVLHMLRPAREEYFPKGTRESVFTYLRMQHLNLPTQFKKEGFDVISYRILPICNAEEAAVFKLIADSYAKHQPSPESP